MNLYKPENLQCPDCGHWNIQVEHVRYEKAFYFCQKCGMDNGSTDKRRFLKREKAEK